jgi:hypothetical protein
MVVARVCFAGHVARRSRSGECRFVLPFAGNDTRSIDIEQMQGLAR